MGDISLNIRKQSAFCMLTVLFILILSTERVESRNIEMQNYRDVMIPEAIVQCRASCIKRFLFEVENMLTMPSCDDNSNCAMCWDFCQTLFIEERHIFKSICTNHTCVSSPIKSTKFQNFSFTHFQKQQQKRAHLFK